VCIFTILYILPLSSGNNVLFSLHNVVWYPIVNLMMIMFFFLIHLIHNYIYHLHSHYHLLYLVHMNILLFRFHFFI
jgi:hypothetical protein